MPNEKLMPGECIMDNDGKPLCNKHGTIVKKEVEDQTEAEEMVEEGIEEEESNNSTSFADKIASVWNKSP